MVGMCPHWGCDVCRCCFCSGPVITPVFLFVCFLTEGCLNINNTTMLGLIRLERSIDGRSLSGVVQHQNQAGRKRVRERGEAQEKRGREGKTVSNLLIYKAYFLNSKSFSIKPHVFP